MDRESLRQKIRANKPKEERVKVPDWGTVLIRGMTARARDEWDQWLSGRFKDDELDNDNIRSALAIRCVYTTDGERLFEDSDEDWLGETDAEALSFIWPICTRISGSSGDEEEEEKNS